MRFEKLKKHFDKTNKIKGWDFSQVKIEKSTVPWDYDEIVKQYLNKSDKVLDIGTGGGEVFTKFSEYFREGVGVDHSSSMIQTAKENIKNKNISNISFLVMDIDNLELPSNSFDVVLLKHLKVNVSEILRVLKPGGYFICQVIGQNSSLNILESFNWTPKSFGNNWWQSVDELAELFQNHECHITVKGEFDIPYWFKNIDSFLYWFLAVPWPENIEFDRHWKNLNQYLLLNQSEKGIKTNEHRGFLIVCKE
jgi:ubiquinone/menaquinone biosynthesis C-methylase UbiE